MKKQKIGVIAGGTLAALVLVAGGFWLGHSHTSSSAASIDGAASIAADAIPASAPAGTTSSSVPLNQTPTAAPTPSGLSVTSNAASNLGQLGGNTNGQSSSGTAPSSSSSSSTASGSSSASQALDPATFSQYDKYKAEKQALFGDVQKGSGADLTPGKKAVVYYRGWLTNGQLFDESRTGSDGKMQPFSFTLGSHQVVSGWEEGLAGMKVGGTRLLIVPPAVGYGAQGQGSVPGNAVMVFEVQLAEVQ